MGKLVVKKLKGVTGQIWARERIAIIGKVLEEKEDEIFAFHPVYIVY